MSTHHRYSKQMLKVVEHKRLKASIPNEKTIKVFLETNAGKNLVHYKNADDLIEKLDLK